MSIKLTEVQREEIARIQDFVMAKVRVEVAEMTIVGAIFRGGDLQSRFLCGPENSPNARATRYPLRGRTDVVRPDEQ